MHVVKGFTLLSICLEGLGKPQENLIQAGIVDDIGARRLRRFSASAKPG